MPEPTTSDAAYSIRTEDQMIRERVKGLTSQALKEGRIDPEAVRDVARAVIGGTADNVAVSGAETRELFADLVRSLDAALTKSASEVHDALQQLAARGKDFTDNDLKEALVSLRRLQQDYTAAASRIAEAMTGNLRREMAELAVHAQNIGVEASARVASMMGEFAEGVGTTTGMAGIRDASARVALLASGVLAGVADALRDQSKAKNST
ncbi:MAG TPA: DUF6781 family protein [Xanthobacteraceae bacterium]|jgi:F0F1-type ATP synthase membrane subunit b/b'|nr:DUF6781 family protein [Xanthobacteraceae bacterium]